MPAANGFFIDGKSDFSLPPRDPVLYYFIQRLRDEAHRFRHRHNTELVARKEMIKNPLDEIAGIGPSPQAFVVLQSFRHRQGGVACRDETTFVAVEGIFRGHGQSSFTTIFHEDQRT